MILSTKRYSELAQSSRLGHRENYPSGMVEMEYASHPIYGDVSSPAIYSGSMLVVYVRLMYAGTFLTWSEVQNYPLDDLNTLTRKLINVVCDINVFV
jgi:hypothetical protein